MSSFSCMWSVLLISLWISFIDGVKVEIKPGDEKIGRAEGKAVVFVCRVREWEGEEEEGVVVEWLDPQRNLIVPGRPRMSVEDDGDRGMKKLYITNITRSDAGSYTCKASHTQDGRAAHQQIVTLVVLEELKVKVTTSSLTPLIHTDVLLGCVAHGQPEPILSWKYMHKRLRMGAPYVSTADGLLIKNISAADSGVYSCGASIEDEGLYVEQQIHVTVQVPPQIIEDLQNVSVVEGETVRLSCKASGSPPPIYHFYKLDDEISDDDDERVTVNKTTGELEIRSVIKSDDDLYKCVAVNPAGQVSGQTVRIHVLMRAVVEIFSDVAVQEGEPVSLTCQSSGDPTPHVVINRAGHNYSLSNQDDDIEEGVVVSSGGMGELILSIDSAHTDHAGDYICSATNLVGSSNVAAKLSVLYKPRFSAANTPVVYGWVGSTFNLTCEAYGEPNPSITWRRQGQQLPPAFDDSVREYKWSDGNLTSSALQIAVDSYLLFADDYECWANNTIGSVTQQYELRQAVSPDEPEAIHDVEILADSVILEVTEPIDNGGIPVLGYTLTHSEQQNPNSIDSDSINDSNMISSNTIKFSGNKTRIVSLKPSTVYVVSVSAYNDVGDGLQLQHVFTTAKPSEPGDITLNVSSCSTDSCDIDCDLYSTGGLPVIEYQINYTKVSESNDKDMKEDWVVKNIVVTSPIKTYALGNLSPESTYIVHMRVRNTIGYGPTSDQLIISTEPYDYSGAQVLRSSLGVGMVVGLSVLILIPILLIIDIRRHRMGKRSVVGACCACVGAGGAEKSHAPHKGDVEKQALRKEPQKNGHNHNVKADEKVALTSETGGELRSAPVLDDDDDDSRAITSIKPTYV